ncbi:PPE domain-containing protein [Nocardia sp. NBC_01377]|uniref:PPE domain-containing protein n=1 Tax=Nocardia sp. NBC_01377 TaxID=2903595 RepID=UPI0038657346
MSELTAGGPGYLVDRVTGLFDGDISPTATESAAQSTGNDSRNRLYTANSELSQSFSGEYTSQVVPPVMETFVGMPHERIMSFIDSIGLGEMSSSVAAWKALATDTTAKATAFHDNIAKEMERGWSGNAANSALAAVRGYLSDVHKVDQAVSLIANKMEEAYTGFQQVSYQVPHPSEARADGKLANVVSTVGDKILDVSGMISGADTRRAQDAEDKANEVMRTVYAPVAAQADNNVPKVPSPTTSGSVPGGDKGDDGSEVPGGGGGSGNSNRPEGNTPDSGESGAENPETEDPGAENPNEDNNADGDSNDTSNDNSSKSTEPAAAQTPGSAAPTTPSSAAPSTPSGLGSGGSHGGGSPSGSGSPGAGSGTPGAGGSVPGSGKSANPTSAGTSGTAASTGRAGMSGVGGMGGGRGGTGKDDESEHNAPDYLRGVHEELLGPETLSVPPVIGDQE